MALDVVVRFTVCTNTAPEAREILARWLPDPAAGDTPHEPVDSWALLVEHDAVRERDDDADPGRILRVVEEVEEGTPPPDPVRLVPASVLDSLARCGFLLAAIDGGDHKAVGNAKDAAAEAARVLRECGEVPEWDECEDRPGGGPCLSDDDADDPACVYCKRDLPGAAQ